MTAYVDRIRHLAIELGIPSDYATSRQLPLCHEATVLAPLGLDCIGRDQFAEPHCAAAWHVMQLAAMQDGIALQLVSAFRSVDYQAALIRRKIEAGKSMDDILQVSAAPGYSEHHTGRALDLTTPSAPMLETDFEQTAAFDWLQNNAERFGFTMSYPRDNRYGIAFEPWHWYFQPLNNR